MNHVEEDGMEQRKYLHQGAADLYWLALLITGDTHASIDLAAGALAFQHSNGALFSDPTSVGARRLLIGEALSTIKRDLTESARRVARRRWQDPDFTANAGDLPRDMTKADLERVLLAMDILPRCVLLVCIFEGLAQNEAAALMDVEPGLIAKAQAIGLCDLTRSIRHSQPRSAHDVPSYSLAQEFAHA